MLGSEAGDRTMFDRIVGWVEDGGYLAIALLMLLENLFPPIPSELIMPLAGFSAAGGKFSLVGVVVAGTTGSVAGALFWFWIGRAIGPDRLKGFARRHGRLLTLHPDGIRADADLGSSRRRSIADRVVSDLDGARDGPVDSPPRRGRVRSAGPIPARVRVG